MCPNDENKPNDTWKTPESPYYEHFKASATIAHSVTHCMRKTIQTIQEGERNAKNRRKEFWIFFSRSLVQNRWRNSLCSVSVQRNCSTFDAPAGFAVVWNDVGRQIKQILCVQHWCGVMRFRLTSFCSFVLVRRIYHRMRNWRWSTAEKTKIPTHFSSAHIAQKKLSKMRKYKHKQNISRLGCRFQFDAFSFLFETNANATISIAAQWFHPATF